MFLPSSFRRFSPVAASPGLWLSMCLLVLWSASSLALEPGVKNSGPIFVEAPFAECHASTILEASAGAGGTPTLLAAWFGGTEEGSDDVGIWLSRRKTQGDAWSAPGEIATGKVVPGEVASGKGRFPTWNPVLFQSRAQVEARAGRGPVILFYKVGPNPREWWGEWISSSDGGVTWTAPQRLPEGILGPIKNKPIELDGGVVLAGSSTEQDASGERAWRVHFELSQAPMVAWRKIGPVSTGAVTTAAQPAGPFGAIQPTLLSHRDGRVQALCRSQQGVVVETWSEDQGLSWSPLQATALPNPNSGLDAVTLADGRHLLVYNHKVREGGRWEGSRSRLNVAVSSDGKHWQAAAELENQPGEYSYPAVIQGRDGTVHITYTWRRQRIQHVEIDPAQLVLQPIVGGKWPSRVQEPDGSRNGPVEP